MEESLFFTILIAVLVTAFFAVGAIVVLCEIYSRLYTLTTEFRAFRDKALALPDEVARKQLLSDQQRQTRLGLHNLLSDFAGFTYVDTVGSMEDDEVTELKKVTYRWTPATRFFPEITHPVTGVVATLDCFCLVDTPSHEDNISLCIRRLPYKKIRVKSCYEERAKGGMQTFSEEEEEGCVTLFVDEFMHVASTVDGK
jgi:hypothetical protein